MRWLFVMLLLAAVSQAQPQVAERDPNAPTYTQMVANGDVEQIVLDQKGPVGLTMLRSKRAQYTILGVFTLAIGVVLVIAGIGGIMCWDYKEAPVFCLVFGLAVAGCGIWILVGCGSWSMMSILNSSNIPVVLR